MKERKFVREYYFNEELWYVNTAPKNPLLNVELMGITHADSDYHIRRQNEWDMYIIEYVLSGKGFIQCNGQLYSVGAGDAYIIRSYTNHEYYADPDDPYEKVWINVSGSLVDHLLAAFNLTDAVVTRHVDLSAHFDELHESLKETYSEEDAANILMRLFYQIFNNYSILQDKNLTLAEKIRQYIDKNINNSIDTETVADFFHLSPIYASRVYKKKYRETIKQYINQSKLMLASQWLKNSDYSIGEISDRLGFCNDNYFAAQFKKTYGISPKQFQLQNQTKAPCNTPDDIHDGHPNAPIGVLHLRNKEEDGQAFADIQLWTCSLKTFDQPFSFSMNIKPTSTWSRANLDFFSFRKDTSFHMHSYFFTRAGRIGMKTDGKDALSEVLPTDMFTKAEWRFDKTDDVYSSVELYINDVKVGRKTLTDPELTTIAHLRMFITYEKNAGMDVESLTAMPLPAACESSEEGETPTAPIFTLDFKKLTEIPAQKDAFGFKIFNGYAALSTINDGGIKPIRISRRRRLSKFGKAAKASGAAKNTEAAKEAVTAEANKKGS